MDDKPSLKGVWSGQVAYLIFLGPNHISGTAKTRVIQLVVQVGDINC